MLKEARTARSAGYAAFVGLVTAVSLFVLPSPSEAATGWSAQLTKISATVVTLQPGQEAPVTVTFKNVGTKTWTESGATYSSLYTQGPKYHSSAIRGSDWKSDSQTGPIDADVAPGKTGTVTFKVKAPDKPGIYNEQLQLAAEDTAWISGGTFSISVNVVKSATAAPAAVPTPTPAPAATAAPAGSLGATRLMMSTDRIVAKGGDKADVTVLFKNSGTETWGVRKLVQDVGLRIATDDATPSFTDPSWPSSTVALAVNDAVAPGRTAFLKFAIRAPSTKGDYDVRFKLVVDDQDVPGGTFDIPVTVTDDAPASTNPQPGNGTSITPTLPTVPAQTLIPEPTIRVGVATVPVDTLVLTSTGGLSVRNQAGLELGKIPLGGQATVKIAAGGAMQVLGGSAPIALNGVVRFVPDAGDGAATKVAAGAGETWSSWADGARFRGTIEIEYYAPADVTWVVNELGIEKYLYGLGEMSNGAPHEYQKALITAARTYAYWHLTNPGKHVTFTVDSTGDQVYRGYDREVQQPNVVRAADETRGQLVNYQGQLVVTPYFANSDGRTRAWTEVWGGAAKPWLVSVVAKYDIGKKLWGHGVGMSARDAAYRADDDGWTWDQLLKYYYTGIDLKELW